MPTDHEAFKAVEREAIDRFKRYQSIGGTRSPDHFHMELGHIVWDYCGMERTDEGLEKALSEIPALHEEFKKDLRVTGDDTNVNQTLEKAGRVDDFFELAQLMCRDALDRNESCGGHFRAEYQTEEGEAQRDDENFAYVAAWEWTGDARSPELQQGTARVRERPPRCAELQVAVTSINMTLQIWRQDGPGRPRPLRHDPRRRDVNDEMSFLEMLDQVNEPLINEGKEAVVFDHDCREGICGTCSLMINGQAHGPAKGTATCQLHMRKFSDGDTIVVEPWRATSFPIIKDLMVDRAAFDRIIEAGGFITRQTGGAPDANLIPIPKPVADAAMDAAACIGCGACVAACPNGAAQLFTSAKIAHLNLLPAGTGRALQADRGDGRHDGGVLRLLHQPRRVPGSVPEVDLHRLHRADEQGLPDVEVQEPPPAQPGLIPVSFWRGSRP